MVPHEICGMVLGQVDSIERKTNLSLDKAKLMAEGQHISIEERVSAMITMLGYRDDRGLLQTPGTPFKAGSPVLTADPPPVMRTLPSCKSTAIMLRRATFIGPVGVKLLVCGSNRSALLNTTAPGVLGF